MPYLVTQPGFPFSPLGLIHVGNKIIQYQPFPMSEVLYTARVCPYRVTDKGYEIDIITTIRNLNFDDVIWQCVTTLLSRDMKKMKKNLLVIIIQ